MHYRLLICQASIHSICSICLMHFHSIYQRSGVGVKLRPAFAYVDCLGR